MRVAVSKWGKDKFTDLKDYITSGLNAHNNETGAVEAASYTADNSVEAMGKLLELLVSKGIIDLDEALIVGGRRFDVGDVRLAPLPDESE